MPRLQATAHILLLCTDFGATTRTKALAPALDLVKDQTTRAQAESQVSSLWKERYTRSQPMATRQKGPRQERHRNKVKRLFRGETAPGSVHLPCLRYTWSYTEFTCSSGSEGRVQVSQKTLKWVGICIQATRGILPCTLNHL